MQPSNAISLIEVTEVGFSKITCFSDVQSAKIPLIAVKLEGIVISVSELHFAKAWVSIVLTDDGLSNMICSNDEHPKNDAL